MLPCHSLSPGSACSHLWSVWLSSHPRPAIPHPKDDVRVLTFGTSGPLLTLALRFFIHRQCVFSPSELLVDF
ncbi:hypothetical protein BKA82DRAFT_4349201 [Pisolithus tinctorius]|nr:hypothetical protein BKA82DRAFT_4349201 [Pisolithus tinctorius]